MLLDNKLIVNCFSPVIRKTITITEKIPDHIISFYLQGGMGTVIKTNYEGTILPENLVSFRFSGSHLPKKIYDEIKNLKHLKELQIRIVKKKDIVTELFDFNDIPASVTTLIEYNSRSFINQQDDKFLQFTTVDFFGECLDLHKFKNVEYVYGTSFCGYLLDKNTDMTLNNLKIMTLEMKIVSNGFKFSLPCIEQLNITYKNAEDSYDNSEISTCLTSSLNSCILLQRLNFRILKHDFHDSEYKFALNLNPSSNELKTVVVLVPDECHCGVTFKSICCEYRMTHYNWAHYNSCYIIRNNDFNGTETVFLNIPSHEKM